MLNKSKRRFLDSMFTSTSILSVSTEVKGDIRCNEGLVMSGTVIGDGKIEGPLQVTKEGSWKGTIHAQQITVAGSVIGDVYAAGKIEIQESAKVEGNLYGSSVAVAKGAQIKGQMSVHDGSDVTFFEERRKNG